VDEGLRYATVKVLSSGITGLVIEDCLSSDPLKEVVVLFDDDDTDRYREEELELVELPNVAEEKKGSPLVYQASARKFHPDGSVTYSLL